MIKNNIQEIEFNEQFSAAYDLLENTYSNVFITGKAGTGKSTLLQFFRDNTKKSIAVCAPTGVAAINIHGQTIHSFFKFKLDVTPDSILTMHVSKSKRKLYESLDTLVIDEISMVRADMLDCINAFLQRFGKHKDIPFGGVQMIFIGDLYQLPPVVTRYEEDLFKEHYQSPYFFDAKSYQYLKLHIIELKKIYRQKEEYFIKLLSKIRNKSATEEQLRYLNSRFIPGFQPSNKDFYVYLTTTNVSANSINQEKLNEIDSESKYFEGALSGDFDQKNLPTNMDLELKAGAQVMLLNNDPKGRWVNGSIGKIKNFLEDGSDDSDSRGGVIVELNCGKRVEVNPFTWEMFRFYYNEDSGALDSECVGSFLQYPLRLAWAMTIHKSQGKTFSKVIVDIGRGAFAHGQVYVALSRCTNFEGLILRKPILKRHIQVDNRIEEFFLQQVSAV